MNHSPLVSVVMSVYNAEKDVYRAISSLLKQSYSNLEVIIINDGSTDSSHERCLEFSDKRIHYIHHNDNKGLHVRLNEGIALASGQYLARMDADDISFLDRIQRQVDFLELNGNVDLIASTMVVMNDIGEPLGVRGQGLAHGDVVKKPWKPLFFPHPTWMGRIEWFQKYGYSHDYVRCEDQELLLRSYGNSVFHIEDAPVLAYQDVNLMSAKAFLSRKNYSRLLYSKYWTTNKLIFLIYSLIYFLISIKVIYRAAFSIKPKSSLRPLEPDEYGRFSLAVNAC